METHRNVPFKSQIFINYNRPELNDPVKNIFINISELNIYSLNCSL